MKALFIHAHFDDYEFTASGTFELWRRTLGEAFEARVLVCTDGKAGHQFRTREETGRIRIEEQAASARIGRYTFEMLRLPNGQPPREACLQLRRTCSLRFGRPFVTSSRTMSSVRRLVATSWPASTTTTRRSPKPCAAWRT